MKRIKTFEIEIERSNVTPAQFLAYLRTMQKKHPEMSNDFNLAYFKAGNDLNFEYHDGTPETRPTAAEKSVSRPYAMQTYILNFDGSIFNEICEFEFDDETTGHGYYYTVNYEVAEEDREANEAEYFASLASRAGEKIERNEKKAAKIREHIETESRWLTSYYIETKTAEAERIDRENAELQKVIKECREHGRKEV